jgi:hypothetical protein
MLKYFFRLLLLIACVIGFFALIGSLLPRSYDFERSIVINVPAEEIFPLLNSPQRWPEWSRQWGGELAEQLDLDIQYNGEAAGVGAAQTWSDPRGSGKLWITESTPNELVEFEVLLANFPPMTSQLELNPNSETATRVTWHSEGTLPGGPFYGYFGGFFSTQMGYEYENSLTKLKSVLEKKAEKPSESTE